MENKIVQKTVIRNTIDSTFLVLRRSQTDTRRPGDWDLAGGALDEGEELSVGALREIQEEAGITPDVIMLRYSFSTIKDGMNYMQMIYAATTNSKEVVLSYEHDLYEWVDAAELRRRFEHLEHYKNALNHIFENNLSL